MAGAGSGTNLWENSEIPKLPLLAMTSTPSSPDRSGMLTPPIHSSSVSVPFYWEEEPGKPRFPLSSTKISNRNDDSSQGKFLELPPRLLLMEGKSSKVPPPIKAMGGLGLGLGLRLRLPDAVGMGKGRGRFWGCSFHQECCGSFRFEKKQLGAMVLRKRGVIEKEWLGLGWFGKRSVALTQNTHSKIKGSFSCLVKPNTQFWETIYEGLKQMNIPWKSKKQRKEHF